MAKITMTARTGKPIIYETVEPFDEIRYRFFRPTPNMEVTNDENGQLLLINKHYVVTIEETAGQPNHESRTASGYTPEGTHSYRRPWEER